MKNTMKNSTVHADKSNGNGNGSSVRPACFTVRRPSGELPPQGNFCRFHRISGVAAHLFLGIRKHIARQNNTQRTAEGSDTTWWEVKSEIRKSAPVS